MQADTEQQDRVTSTIDRCVYAEQIKLLYQALPVGIAANCVSGVLLVGIQSKVIDNAILIPWLIVFELTILFRTILYLKYSRTSTIEDYSPWGKGFNVGVALTGTLWGIAGIAMFPVGNELYQLTVIFCLLGMSAGSVGSHSFHKAPPYIFVTLLLVPLFFRFLYEGGDLGYWLALILVVSISYLLSTARRNSEITVRNIRLRFDAIEKEKEVEKSRQLAEKANHAKSDFLSRTSHELRTPLNAIVGFGQLLEMSDISQPDKEKATHIVKAGMHLVDLINEILDIARIESGHQDLTFEPVLINDVLMDVVTLVQPLADKNNVTLIPAMDKECYSSVLVDEQRLKQVFLNLMSNAIKYNNENGRVSLFCSMASNEVVRISITDTGKGIDPEYLLKIFDPFERLGAEKTEIEGTGIGLAHSKALIDVMGGTLGVDSESGVGSTFWVELPLCENKVESDSLEIKTELDNTQEVVMDNQMTVLYIEDNKANLRLVEAVLKDKENIRLLTADLGESGYALAIKHQPNIILLDLNLPDISGYEILIKLKAHQDAKSIPVIVVSADATKEQMTNVNAAGAYAYLTKPFDIKALIKVIEEAANSD